LDARVESTQAPPAPPLSLDKLLTTLALKASDIPMPLRVLRYLDFALLVLAVGWTLQRAIQYGIEKRARASDDPRTVAGLLTGSMIARGWIVAGSIFIVGLSEREAGLSAAILAITLFTFYFTSQMLTRPFEENR
jgi:hypothetical protein